MERSITVEATLSAPQLTVEIRDYRFPTPNESTECESDPVLGFNLARPDRMGEGCHALGSVPRYVPFGALLFMPGGIPFHNRGAGGRHRVAAYRFQRRHFETVTGLTDWDAGRLAACLNIRSQSVEDAALRLVREAEAPGFASAMLAEGVGLSLAVELARHLRVPVAPPRGAAPLSAAELARIRDRLETVEGRAVRLSELADLTGRGVRTLTRAFRAATGQTVGQFTEAVMLRRARRLLEETDLPLKEIAWRLGFAHPAAFTTAFRRAAGISPVQYRRR